MLRPALALCLLLAAPSVQAQREGLLDIGSPLSDLLERQAAAGHLGATADLLPLSAAEGAVLLDTLAARAGRGEVALSRADAELVARYRGGRAATAFGRRPPAGLYADGVSPVYVEGDGLRLRGDAAPLPRPPAPRAAPGPRPATGAGWRTRTRAGSAWPGTSAVSSSSPRRSRTNAAPPSSTTAARGRPRPGSGSSSGPATTPTTTSRPRASSGTATGSSRPGSGGAGTAGGRAWAPCSSPTSPPRTTTSR